MTFPVLVEPCDGQFATVLVGAPTIQRWGRPGPGPSPRCKPIWRSAQHAGNKRP